MKLNVVFSNYHYRLIKTDYDAEFSPEPMISFCKYLIGKSGDSERLHRHSDVGARSAVSHVAPDLEPIGTGGKWWVPADYSK